jgi:hypothetical protein
MGDLVFFNASLAFVVMGMLGVGVVGYALNKRGR